MTVKLKKIGENYWLQDGIIFFACSDKEKVFGDLKYLLDKSQIEALFKPDLNKIATERFWKWNGKDFEDHEITQIEKGQYVSGFKSGYNQCLEDNAEKKFTLRDMEKCFNDAKVALKFGSFEEYKKFLSWDEEKIGWDVEIETEDLIPESISEYPMSFTPTEKVPKVKNGYINILKIIK